MRESIVDAFIENIIDLFKNTYNINDFDDKFTIFKEYFKQFILRNKFIVIFLRLPIDISLNKDQ